VRIALALLVAACAVARGSDLHAGYQLHSNQAGLSHSIAGEASWDWVETGFAVGYGAKPIHEQVIDQSPGRPGPSIKVYGRAVDAFRLDVPVRIKWRKWPYLLAQLGYQRLQDIPGMEATLEKGFAKSNEITPYWTDPAAPAFSNRVVFDSERFASKVVWQAGLRYRFRAPGS
jgi:hypothetical protein